MPSLQRYECESCGAEFGAAPDANAADGPYCSPACEIEGEGLA